MDELLALAYPDGEMLGVSLSRLASLVEANLNPCYFLLPVPCMPLTSPLDKFPEKNRTKYKYLLSDTASGSSATGGRALSTASPAAPLAEGPSRGRHRPGAWGGGVGGAQLVGRCG